VSQTQSRLLSGVSRRVGCSRRATSNQRALCSTSTHCPVRHARACAQCNQLPRVSHATTTRKHDLLERVNAGEGGSESTHVQSPARISANTRCCVSSRMSAPRTLSRHPRKVGEQAWGHELLDEPRESTHGEHGVNMRLRSDGGAAVRARGVDASSNGRRRHAYVTFLDRETMSRDPLETLAAISMLARSRAARSKAPTLRGRFSRP
jgi:hypothetical protein